MKRTASYAGYVTILILSLIISMPAQAQFAGGSGTPEDPYRIETPQQFDQIRNHLSNHFILTNDVNLSAQILTISWFPIGTESSPFTGSLDGDGYTILNVEIITESTPLLNDLGLFGYTSGASFKDIVILGIQVNSNTGNLSFGNNHGGLVGRSFNTTIQNCHINPELLGDPFIESFIEGSSNVGGLVGYSISSTISNSSSSNNFVLGIESVGGLVGHAFNSIIDNSYTTSKVKGMSKVGGAIGLNDNSNVSRTYATGNINGASQVGGIIGVSQGTSSTGESYSAGKVEGDNQVGGAVGAVFGGSLFDIYWNIETSEQANGVGEGSSENVSGLTQEEMLQEVSFINFDFDLGWQIIEGSSYPFLTSNPQDPPPFVEVVPEFAGGDGSLEDRFQVENCDQLSNVRDHPNANFIQIADFSCDVFPFNVGEGFDPLSTNTLRFAGNYDGDGYSISDLFIDTEFSYASLFGYIENAEIRNLELVNFNIDGNQFVGAIAGRADASNIENIEIIESQLPFFPPPGSNQKLSIQESDTSFCNIRATGNYAGGLVGYTAVNTVVENISSDCRVYSTGLYVGGIVGLNLSSKVLRSSVTGDVIGDRLVGGVVGDNDFFQSVISDSYSTGKVEGIELAFRIGGIAGRNEGRISNSYSTSDVSGDNQVGGIVGQNLNNGVIENVYATGMVVGNETTDIILGSDSGTLSGAFWNIETAMNDTATTGIGLADSLMRKQASFTPFNFDSVWVIREDSTFPYLQNNIQSPAPGAEVILPDVISLSSPANNAIAQAVELSLVWSGADDSESYQVQLSEDSLFSDLLINFEVLNGTSIPITDLEYLTDYFWRVRGINGFGAGAWSNTWKFSTRGLPPAQILLSSPADSAENVSVNPTLAWNGLENASSYTIQVSESDQFTELIIEDDAVSEASYSVSDLSGLTTYYWRVLATNEFGDGEWSNTWQFTTEMTVSNEDELGIPTEVGLSQNFPNPFNPMTSIQYQLPEAADVQLFIYDLLGRKIATLINQRVQSGYHTIQFDATHLSSGIYIYQLNTGDQVFTKKMMLIK